MRQFLYLNTDIVNSILAQDGKGLIDAYTTEHENGKIDSEKNSLASGISGEIGASLLKLAKAEASFTINGDLEDSVSTHNTTKEIIAKTLHDAAFDMAYDVIKPIKIEVGNDDGDTGDYIEMTRVFDFIDLDYLEGLFSNNGIVDYLKKTEKDKIKYEAQKQAEENLNREQKRHNTKRIAEIINEQSKLCDEKYSEIYNIINAIRNAVPYGRMLASYDGYLIPTEEKYFRVNPTSLGFMYGGEIRCVGMITNIIGEDTNPNDETNAFATLQFLINETLRALLPTKEENIYIVSPIAIYYE